MLDITFLLRLLAALGSGLIGGLFFAFSVSVMGALARIQPAEGIAAMQSINRVILNPVFFLAFFGTALLCLMIALASLWNWSAAGAGYALAGAALYLVGSIAVTVVFNVPLNNALAAASASTSDGAAVWAHYLATWVPWNHVRAVACLAASALLTMAIYVQGRAAG
jgi:uncharacterized membrane protein